MEAAIGLLIIALGAFCQSSCYVPIKRIQDWSWESYWFVQGIFAWLVWPLLGAMLAVPPGSSLLTLFESAPAFNVWMTLFFGVLWGVGGLTFGLSMRYLGVALGQSIALGTCAALGTVMGPLLIHTFFPEQGALAQLTGSVMLGVVVTLLGIAIIGYAGKMKSDEMDDEKDSAVVEFNFPKGIAIALLCGLMSGCFNVGLEFGKDIHFGALTPDLFKSLPATLLVTLGGFFTNAAYCFWQNHVNKTWGDYARLQVWPRNLFFCLLAGVLWYSQFFGLSLGKGFLQDSPTLLTLSFCILMALNVIFSNLWGLILKEWKGCSKATISVLLLGILVLVVSTFISQLL